MQETQVQPLGQEDPLVKGMATYSSTTTDWRIPWTEEPSRLQSTGSQRVGHDWVTKHTQYFIISNWEKIHSSIDNLGASLWLYQTCRIIFTDNILGVFAGEPSNLVPVLTVSLPTCVIQFQLLLFLCQICRTGILVEIWHFWSHPAIPPWALLPTRQSECLFTP